MIRSQRLAYAALIALALAIALLPMIPLASGSDDEPAFSADRALAHIEELSRAPHPMGSEESRRVSQVIIDELSEVGMDSETQSITAPDYFGAPGNTVEVVNVMARIDGFASTGAVALMGHYDTVPTTNGANDNSSAIAVMLETARVLTTSEKLQNDVILLFTDGEEPAPKFGSQPFVDSHPWFDDIAFVLNLEALGSAGPSLVTDINGPTEWVVDQYSEAAPRPAVFSFATALTDLIGGSNTDLAPFRDAGVSGMEYAYVRNSSIYHTPADSIETVGRLSLAQHGANALGLIRHLGGQDLQAPQDDSSTAFFTVGPGWVVHHHSGWLIAAVLASGFLLGLVALRQRAGLAREVGGVIGRIVIVMVGFTALWVPLASWRSDMRVVESSIYLVLFAALSVFASRYLRRDRSRAARPIAVAIVWWMWAALSLLDPGLGYLFVWPAAAAALLIWFQHTVDRPLRRWERFTGFGLIWLITLPLMVPAIEFLFVLAQPRPGNPGSQILWTMALPALLLSLVAELVTGTWPRTEPRAQVAERLVDVPALT